MDTTSNECVIKWITTEIDDLSLLLRAHNLDRVADLLDEAIGALAAQTEPSMTSENAAA